MNIDATQSAAGQGALQSTSATNETSDRDLFMTLLVAQLKNQDPLAPQEGTEFVAQLAQFNSLEQLTNIRESIEQLVRNTQQQTGV
ncbi:MAG: hypothetical protein HKN25_16955 [Pyrinomonadaceae bacterium]|nr:hypothetical protein [Pyrinomonadaceae bacterium]